MCIVAELFMDISHTISEPVENQDYYKDFEAPQGRRQDLKLSKPTVTLEMERPPHVPLPGASYYSFDDDDYDDDDDEEEDFTFGSPFFPFF